jgi:hypothetical protein
MYFQEGSDPRSNFKMLPGAETGGDKVMVNLGDAGRICLNREIQGVCKSCLWWEWDPGLQRCGNAQYHVCPLYREQLFNKIATANVGQTYIRA